MVGRAIGDSSPGLRYCRNGHVSFSSLGLI